MTQGTLTEDTLLDARAHSYLAALAEAGGELGLAWLDMTTGDFAVQPVTPGELGCGVFAAGAIGNPRVRQADRAARRCTRLLPSGATG